MAESLVSISLVTYNGEKYISGCLNSVFNQTYPEIEVIIIDNGSTDKTVEILKESRIKNQGLRIISNKENLGFAAGHNINIKESRGKFVLCLNQDIVLDKDFIKEAIEVMGGDEKIGAVQGKLYCLSEQSESKAKSQYPSIRPDGLAQGINQTTSIIDTTGLIILKNRRIINRGQGEKDIGQYNQQEEIFGVDGAAPIYRKEALEDVKIRVNSRSRSALDPRFEYFDEDFFAYKEDIDLSWRLRLYGWKIVYNPKSIAWHKRKAKGKEKKGKQIINIIQSRKELSPYIQHYSFKNQRLMQIKNELTQLFLKHLPWILPKEIVSWFYVLFFERETWPAIVELFKQTPRAWQKRKVIMTNKKVNSKEIEKWFQ